MAYMVSWGCFIMDDSLTPIEAAQEARDRSLNPSNQAWHVINLETDVPTVVNLKDNTIMESGRSKKIA